MRYGIYFIPGPGSLSDLATSWLGYDILTGKTAMRSEIMTELVPDLDVLTAAPCRYGFHATVKAPFRLMPGSSVSQLQEALEGLCLRLSPVSLPGLTVREMEGFFCLVPADDSESVRAMAAKVVQELDSFRAPLGDEEWKKRMEKNLTAREQVHLIRWGYPYTMEDFHFHMSLTGPVAGQTDREEIRKLLEVYLYPACGQPLQIDALCLVRESEAGARFELVRRFAFGGQAA